LEHPWAKLRLLNLHACQFMFLIEIYVLFAFLMSEMQRRNYKDPRKTGAWHFAPIPIEVNYVEHSQFNLAICIGQPPQEKISVGSEIHSTGCRKSGFCL